MINKINISHENGGTINKNCVRIATENGSVDFYFSYQTLVAVNGVVSVNNWGRTTGKLLNELQSDKSLRVEHEEVLKEADKVLKGVLFSQKELIANNL